MERFTVNRVDPLNCFIEAAGRRVDGVPLSTEPLRTALDCVGESDPWEAMRPSDGRNLLQGRTAVNCLLSASRGGIGRSWL